MDIAIINSWLITLEGKGLGIVKNGGIGIEDGKITYVGKMSDFRYQRADRIIDGKNKHAVIPGLINAHTHSILTLCRGAVHDVPEIEYMPKGLDLFINHLKGQDFILGTKLAVLEGLRAGTTTFAEYGMGIAGLVRKIFLPFNARVVATETINELSLDEEKKQNKLYTFNKFMGRSAFKRANKLFREFKSEELVTTIYGPQALDMISIELLKEIKEQAVENNSKIHVHVAQGGRERIQITLRYGNDMTTVGLLRKNDLLDSHLIAAHIHDTTEAERNLMVKEGVKMVGCPSSISKIDGIVPPLGNYVQLGGIAGLGTDEAPGTGHHNLFTEMKMACLLTKVLQKDPTAMPPWEALRLATIGGAKVLGLEDKIGSLKVGKSADVITVNLNHAHLTPVFDKPFNNIVANLIYSSKGNEVDNVIIAGNPIILESSFVNIDEKSIINDASKRAQQIFENITEDWRNTNSKMVSYQDQGFI